MTPRQPLERVTGWTADDYDRDFVAHALAVCREELSRNPNEPDLWHLRGLLALREQDLDLALACLAPPIAAARLNLDYLTDHGDALRQRGRLTEALGAYLRVLTCTPDDVNLYWRIGATLNERGHWHEAISVLEIANRLAPNVAQVHRALGDVLFGIGRVELAIESFERSVRFDPSDTDSWQGLGQAWLRRRDWARACTAFELGL